MRGGLRYFVRALKTHGMQAFPHCPPRTSRAFRWILHMNDWFVKEVLLQLASYALFCVAGFSLYVSALNRILFRVPDGFRKKAVNWLMLLFFLVGSALTGLLAPPIPALFAPLIVLAVLFLAELHRLHIRRRCKGTQPSRSVAKPFSLTRPVTTTSLAVLRYEVSLPQWQGPAFRTVHVTDIHANQKLPIEYYQQAIAMAKDAQADLGFYTGDFVSKPHCIPLLRDIVQPLARQGTFAVLGNHDYWAGPATVSEILREKGVRLLHNGCERLMLGAGRLVISGCEAPWGRPPWIRPATEPGELLLVATHTADNIYTLCRAGVDLVFAGHYHGGQFKLPFFGPLAIPSVYGRRFDHGHFILQKTHLFVSAGIGSAAPPLRLYCHPDILIVDFKPGTETQTP